MTLTTGGNVSNVGIDLSKLGFRVGAITRVGNDGLGNVLMEEYRRNAIDITGIVVDTDAQTSATIVSVDRAGERTFLHTRGCMANFRAEDIMKSRRLIESSKCFVLGYLGLLPELEPAMAAMLKEIKDRSGIPIVLDTGGAPARLDPKRLGKILSSVDYFLPSFEEAVRLTGRKTPEKIADLLLAAGARNVVGVKLGARGCYVATKDRRGYLRSSRVRNPVDTTGAGDAFVAGFTAGILKGLDPFEAADLGNKVAASCVTALGASTAIERLEHYLP